MTRTVASRPTSVLALALLMAGVAATVARAQTTASVTPRESGDTLVYIAAAWDDFGWSGDTFTGAFQVPDLGGTPHTVVLEHTLEGERVAVEAQLHFARSGNIASAQTMRAQHNRLFFQVGAQWGQSCEPADGAETTFIRCKAEMSANVAERVFFEGFGTEERPSLGGVSWPFAEVRFHLQSVTNPNLMVVYGVQVPPPPSGDR